MWQWCCPSDFHNVWAHLPCCLMKGPLKCGFSDIYVTIFFAVCKLWKTSAMSVIFVSRIFKVWLRFQNCSKKLLKSFYFWDKCIRIGYFKLSLLKREFLSSALNILTNSLKILHINKRDFYQLNCFHSGQ